jgi:hypothetical protein
MSIFFGTNESDPWHGISIDAQVRWKIWSLACAFELQWTYKLGRLMLGSVSEQKD